MRLPQKKNHTIVVTLLQPVGEKAKYCILLNFAVLADQP